MPFLDPMRRPSQSRNFKMHMIITGIFIGLSYMLSLLPLALFAIAQTLAIFGKKATFILSASVVFSLCLLAIFTGFSPLVLGALFSVISVPIFLIVSILRQKHTRFVWSAAVLFVPVILFFSALLSAPVFNQEEYISEFQKIENSLTNSQLQDKQKVQNDHVYAKVHDQLELLKRDSELQSFMSYSPSQRALYFVYGAGVSILLGVLLSFFASLFFLDFAFEQVEKLQVIKRYVSTLPAKAFDNSFLNLLRGLTFKGYKETKSDTIENIPRNTLLDFKIVKHIKFDAETKSEKSFFGVLSKPKPTHAIYLREYVFYYAGKLPGWNLRNYQMPLILCILSIMVLAGAVFYFGDVQNIINVVGSLGILAVFFVTLSVFSICALSLLVLQGIFTALRWITFGLLVLISIVFLIVSPYIMIDMGPYVFLSIFGVIGLLGYLK